MKEYITESRFIDWFRSSDSYENNFSYYGLKALFQHLEEYESGIGEELDFDPVAIACDYTEYSDIDAVKEDYPNIEDLEDLQNNTQVIEYNEKTINNTIENGVIIQVF